MSLLPRSLIRRGLPVALALSVAGAAHGQPAEQMPAPQSPDVPFPSSLVPPPPADTQAPAPPPAPVEAPPAAAPPPAGDSRGDIAAPTALAPIPGQAPADTSATVPGAGAPVDAGALQPAPPPAGPIEPAPVAVQAAPLSAPDLFSSGTGSTGLPADLWKGASLDLARRVAPMASTKPLSPAAAAFARRLMSTAASAPAGGGADADLAAARVGAVLATGDAAGARAMLEHTAGMRDSAALSQVAAEADLVLGREDDACAVGDALAAGKDGPYWRRLRAFCLLKAGNRPEAQLAYDLAAEQAKDDTYKRLMGAAVSGGPQASSAAGEASLRNGMEYALSRRLQLDLAPAMDKAWPPIPPAVVKDPTASPAAQAAAAARVQAMALNDVSRASALDPSVRDAALSLADDKLAEGLSDALAGAGEGGAGQAQAGEALYLAAGAPASAHARLALAGFDIGASSANQARLLALDAASGSGAKGDAALLALWLAADAGQAGPTAADRARIVRALMRAGFRKDARAYALEGLLALQPPPAAAAPPPKKPPPPRRKR